MTLDTTCRNQAFLVPVSPSFSGAGEVAGVFAMGSAQINRCAQFLIQAFDGIIGQLNKIFSTVCITTWILKDGLVVLGCFS